VWPVSAYPSARQSEGPQPTSKLEIIQSWACITEPLLVGNLADRVGPVALRPRIAPGLPLPMSDPMAELNDRQFIYSSLLLDSTGGRALLDPQTHASTKQVSASRHTVFRHTLRTCFLPRDGLLRNRKW
jgi:hypothetical protein